MKLLIGILMMVCFMELFLIIILTNALANEKETKEALEHDLREYEDEKLNSGFEKQEYIPYENLFKKWEEQEDHSGDE